LHGSRRSLWAHALVMSSIVNSIAQERSTLNRNVNLQLFYCAALRSIALIWIKQMLEWRDDAHAAKEKASAPRWLGG
jgi:hypothetical protein